MAWEPEIEELKRRRALAARGGTPDRVERQHAQGRYVVRERGKVEVGKPAVKGAEVVGEIASQDKAKKVLHLFCLFLDVIDAINSVYWHRCI